jgi:hypothetical protein
VGAPTLAAHIGRMARAWQRGDQRCGLDERRSSSHPSTCLVADHHLALARAPLMGSLVVFARRSLLRTAFPSYAPLPPPPAHTRTRSTSSPRAIDVTHVATHIDALVLCVLLSVLLVADAIDVLVKAGMPTASRCDRGRARCAPRHSLVHPKKLMLSTYPAPWHLPRPCSRCSQRLRFLARLACLFSDA